MECKTICMNESGMEKIKLYSRKMTNEKLVQDMMKFSQAGVLKQAFIIEAIRVYSEQTLTVTKEEWGENNFINLEAWQQCARECVDAIKNRG
jgi:hypothetical protein